MQPRKRFSKNLMLAEIDDRIETLMTWNHFDPNNGTAQLKGRSQDTILDYGKVEALRSLRDAIEGGYYSERSGE